MKACVCLCLALVCTLFLGCRRDKPLQDFIREAAQAAGRPIHIKDISTPRRELGFTHWDNPDEVVIEVVAGLPREIRRIVLAHELGHVIVFANGFSTAGGLTTIAQKHDRAFMLATGHMIANCYIDPLADGVATKRGFDVAALNDYVIKQDADSPPDLNSQLAQNEWLWPNFEAMYVYCLNLRPHTLPIAMEVQRLVKIPNAKPKWQELTAASGSTTCADPQQCFEATKKLRDTSGFAGFILLRNPRTKQLE